MKTLITIVIAAMITCCTYAQKVQKADVPSEVKNAFHKQFSTAKELKWEKEHGNFEAKFELNGIDHSAVFDAKGTLLETEVAIKTKELPGTAMQYIQKNYTGQKIKEAAKITDAKGIVTYEAEINNIDLIFDSNGKFIKQEKEDKKRNDQE